MSRLFITPKEAAFEKLCEAIGYAGNMPERQKAWFQDAKSMARELGFLISITITETEQSRKANNRREPLTLTAAMGTDDPAFIGLVFDYAQACGRSLGDFVLRESIEKSAYVDFGNLQKFVEGLQWSPDTARYWRIQGDPKLPSLLLSRADMLRDPKLLEKTVLELLSNETIKDTRQLKLFVLPFVSGGDGVGSGIERTADTTLHRLIELYEQQKQNEKQTHEKAS